MTVIDDPRDAGITLGERAAKAIEPVAAMRDDGRWPLATRYSGAMPVEIDADEGQPGR